jgi:hypothetical protein
MALSIQMQLCHPGASQLVPAGMHPRLQGQHVTVNTFQRTLGTRGAVKIGGGGFLLEAEPSRAQTLYSNYIAVYFSVLIELILGHQTLFSNDIAVFDDARCA